MKEELNQHFTEVEGVTEELKRKDQMEWARKDCFKMKTLDEYKTEQMKNSGFVKEYDLIQPELKEIREEINQNILQESKITIEK